MASSNEPLSTRRGRKQNPVFVFIIFTLVGLVMSYFFIIRPVAGVWAARSWKATPCRILSSEVGRHHASKGTTYSVDITYQYQVGGQEIVATRYDFMGGASSGYESKARAVDRYPEGSEAVCYVNPGDPNDAVLDRNYPDDMWIGSIPLAFTGAGVAGLIGTRKRNKLGATWAPAVIPASGVTTWGQTVARPSGDIGIVSADPPGAKEHDTPVELSPAMTSGYKALVATMLLLLCGGGCAAIVISNLPHWREFGISEGNSFPLACILGVITIPILVAAVTACMRLSDPRIHVRIAPGTVRLGEDFTLEWQAQGGRRALSQLLIVLECREESDFQAGKNSGTATSICYRSDLVHTQAPDQLAAGSLKLRLPAGVMHSFDGGRNRIAWKMRVIGSVPRWVGVKDEYAFVILPEGAI